MSKYLKETIEIVKWMKRNKTTNPPSQSGKTEEERKLGRMLSTIRQRIIKPYNRLETEDERAAFRERYQGVEKIIKIVERIDKNRIPAQLENARNIKEWMDKNNTIKPPRQVEGTQAEAKLGNALNTIRQSLIKPYKKLETEEERVEYRKKHPEIDEVMEIIESIDENMRKNTVPFHLENARKINNWVNKNNMLKFPSQAGKTDEEKGLGAALSRIRNKLVKPYIELETEEEKSEFRVQHPEVEEVIEILNNMEKSISKNKVSVHLENARKIKEWMEKNNKTKQPSKFGKTEEEAKLSGALERIKHHLINPYRDLKTEEEREKFREKHPELDEVMKILLEKKLVVSEEKQKELMDLINEAEKKREALEKARRLEKQYKALQNTNEKEISIGK